MVFGVVGGGGGGGDLTGYASGIKATALWSAEESRVTDWVWCWGFEGGIWVTWAGDFFCCFVVCATFSCSSFPFFPCCCLWVIVLLLDIPLALSYIVVHVWEHGDRLVLWAGHLDQTARHCWSDCWAEEGYLAGHHFASLRFVSFRRCCSFVTFGYIPLGWLRDHTNRRAGGLPIRHHHFLPSVHFTFFSFSLYTRLYCRFVCCPSVNIFASDVGELLI